MLKQIRVIFFAILILLCSGCIYTNVKYPMDEDVLNTELGTKVGKANNHIVLWLFAWGDAGTQAAAQNGDIKIIKHLDTERVVYLFGVYSRVSTIAYGD
jgi:hypothetical protein